MMACGVTGVHLSVPGVGQVHARRHLEKKYNSKAKLDHIWLLRIRQIGLLLVLEM